MKVALVQLNSGDDPAENLLATLGLIQQAADEGAEFVLTPEVTNCLSFSRRHQNSVLQHEDSDPTLAALRTCATTNKIWLLIGSLALKTNDQDGRFANRSFMISPSGEITARYDKIHMFDVDVSKTESYRESDGYRPGDSAVTAKLDEATVGMTICYDVRFPHLHRALAHAGADIITVPAAFAETTGRAHWETLLRARAIETGCFVLAPAQTGEHSRDPKKSRKTWGHSLAISPWGEILADGGADVGITMVELDLSQVAATRRRIPSLSHDRKISAPI